MNRAAGEPRLDSEVTGQVEKSALGTFRSGGNSRATPRTPGQEAEPQRSEGSGVWCGRLGHI